MRTRAALISLALIATACVACAARDTGVTPLGKGKPQVSISFPGTAEPGSVQEAVVNIINPGPGAIDRLSVTFVRVGPGAGGQPLPIPIVDAAQDVGNRAVVGVDPQPDSVSDDDVVYVFDGLEVGGSLTIRFRLRLPEQTGIAANSITVSDASDLDRAVGVRLETLIER